MVQVYTDAGGWLPVQGDSRGKDLVAFLFDRSACGAPTFTEGALGDAHISGEPAIIIRWEDPGGVNGQFADYAIHTRSDGSVEISAMTDLGFEVAFAHFARLCGYLALAPTPEWHLPIRPNAVDRSITIDPPGKVALPLRLVVGLGVGCGVLSGQLDRMLAWRHDVGMADAIKAKLSHAWPSFVTETSPPPAWYSTTGKKLHMENPEVVAAFVVWAREAADGYDLFSVSASDGAGGWPEIPMSPSDAQLIGGNACAEDGQDAAVYAYGFQCEAPTIPFDPRVTVVWATAYMQPTGAGQPTAETVLQRYRDAGATKFIVGDYPFVWPWGHCLPGQDRGALYDELVTLIGRLRIEGVYGLTTDAGCCWAPAARAYGALAAYFLGGDPDDAFTFWEDFPSRAFPSAIDEATVVYGYLSTRVPWNVGRSTLFMTDVLALLDEVNEPGFNGDEFERALDLGRYAVSCDLWAKYKAAPSSVLLESFLRWGCRIRHRDLVDYRCPYADGTLTAHRKAIAAAHGLPTGADLNPFQPVWPDAEDLPDVGEVLEMLGGES